jgi:hypothetical protein
MKPPWRVARPSDSQPRCCSAFEKAGEYPFQTARALSIADAAKTSASFGGIP